MASPQPLYDPAHANPAYELRYSWCGWPSNKTFDATPGDVLETVKPLWETDGLRLLEHRWTSDRVQLLFSATPETSPVLLAARAKGRLDHALRGHGYRMPFSRKLAVRSVGHNTRRDVEAYIERQVDKEPLAAPRFKEKLREFTVAIPGADLSQPTAVAHGRYWYNLHVVLVVERRHRVHDLTVLAAIRDGCFKIAEKKTHLVSRVSVMPDHLHVSLRGLPAESPQEIALAYQNNLAYLLGQRPLWKPGYYAGTFSEYDMDAVRRCVAEDA